MTLCLRLAVAAVTMTSLLAHMPTGEVGGRISDEERWPLPGVRVSITNDDELTETVTDDEGRFLFRSVPVGTYRVVAELAGFKTVSGEIAISPSTPRAFLAWSLETGCPGDHVRVILGPRAAAPMVETIVHMRVSGIRGPVRISVDPDCEGRVLQEYSVQVIDRVPSHGVASRAQQSVFMDPRDARLTPAQEYLALLWPDARATDDLVLPIVAGRVVAPDVGELNGLPASEALNVLAKWSEEESQDAP